MRFLSDILRTCCTVLSRLHICKAFSIFLLSASLILVITFQNCSPTRFTRVETELASSSPGDIVAYNNCSFNGSPISHGEATVAYQNSTVPYSSNCTAETRTCNNGILSGSYQYALCEVGQPASCLFNGQTIPSGETVMAYLTSNVGYGESCRSQTRTCNNGALSGSYTFATCNVGAPAACLFNGQTIAHGQSATAFLSSAVPSGQSCSSQQRTCNNGVLTGNYPYASCVVNPYQNCQFGNQTVLHGQSVTAYQDSSVAFGGSCSSQQRTCSNGNLSGHFAYSSCQVASGASCSFGNQSLIHGQNVTAYLASSVPYGSSCTSETRTCNNGTLSGNYAYVSCTIQPPAACSFNNRNINHGQTVTAYQTSLVRFGSSCSSQVRTCNNGALSGTYGFANCVVDSPATCNFNGLIVSHGQSVTAYAATSAAYGSTCQSESRVCTNGSLSGSYSYGNCAANSPLNCSFNGLTVNHGQTTTAYQTTSVPYGSSCISQNRTCNNGILSGDYTYSACAVGQAANCSFNGNLIANGQSVTAYQATSAPFGSTCISQTRTCTNGVLSGSYAYGSCSIEAATTCSFNGQSVNHGQTVTAYQSASVQFGSTCTSQTRTCTNGVLSGSYAHSSCQVNAAASCGFNGLTISHGSSVTAYASSGVTNGQTCTSQSRVCNNGILSGTYPYAACSVSNPGDCNFNGVSIPNGQNVTAYSTSSVPYGSVCQSQTRTCSNGALSGSYPYGNCLPQPPGVCGFNGQVVEHGQSVIAYATTAVPYGSTCQPQTRICNNGALSGSYTYGSCQVSPPASCLFNGQTLAHGQNVVAYFSTHSSTCSSEIRTCQNGLLSGSAVYNFCSLSPQCRGTKYLPSSTSEPLSISCDPNNGAAVVITHSNITLPQGGGSFGTGSQFRYWFGGTTTGDYRVSTSDNCTWTINHVAGASLATVGGSVNMCN